MHLPCNINHAKGKQSLHLRWNFILTFTKSTWPWRRTYLCGVDVCNQITVNIYDTLADWPALMTSYTIPQVWSSEANHHTLMSNLITLSFCPLVPWLKCHQCTEKFGGKGNLDWCKRLQYSRNLFCTVIYDFSSVEWSELEDKWFLEFPSNKPLFWNSSVAVFAWACGIKSCGAKKSLGITFSILSTCAYSDNKYLKSVLENDIPS